ncbi:hypothetical protein C8R44DRAFT_856616 [Mycena epipterygia]|nr:hypothetical protein C8R44DRAFT_856616 [Mycena epipterygia]
MSGAGYRQSFYTESTVPSTVWGPGTLAGRAILALGEATLRGLDRVIDRESRAIQKRLEAIRGSVPHLAPEMYCDLIELARPDLYPQYILEAATDIVFHQLELGYGAALALSVAQLSLSEARLVMLRMLISRDFDVLDEDSPMGARSPRKALDVLTMLVQLRPEMTASCFDVLDQLFLNPHICMRLFRFRDHPILRIRAEEDLNIPPICRTPLSELQLRFSQDRMYRWKSWKLLESAGHPIESRLLQLNAVLLNAVAQESCWTPDFFDAAFDLFDFLSYSQVPELRRAATDQLIACISFSRDSWEPLSVVLDFISRSTIMDPRPSPSLRYDTYTPKTPTSPTAKTDAGAPPELGLQFHPQLREFLRYAHLRPHARDAHLQFWQRSPLAVPVPEIPGKSPRDLSGMALQSKLPPMANRF